MIVLLTLAFLFTMILIFLSTFESAFDQLSDVQLRVVLAESEKGFQARFLKELVENPHRFLLTLSMGVHLMIVSLTITVVTLFHRLKIDHPLLASLLVMICVISVFRQFLPRLLAQNDPEKVLLRLVPIFSTVYSVFWPPAYPIHRALQSLKSQPQPEAEEEDAEEEIQAYIDVGKQEGIIEGSEGQLIQSIVELGERHVRELMTPRGEIVAIGAEASVREALQLAVASKYSRLPVYRERLDDVQGIVYLRDLLRLSLSGDENKAVTSVMRPAYFIPETKRADDLLEEMKQSATHIAMVIDEYGSVAGLITLEDLTRAIIGEIKDEDKAEPAEIVKQPDGSFIVNGTTEIRKLESFFNTEVESDDFTTVAGLVIHQLNHLPSIGEAFQFKGLSFEVVDADPRRVRTVRIRPLETAKPKAAREEKKA